MRQQKSQFFVKILEKDFNLAALVAVKVGSSLYRWSQYEEKDVQWAPTDVRRPLTVSLQLVWVLSSITAEALSVWPLFTVSRYVRGSYKHFSLFPPELTISHSSVHWVRARDRTHLLQSVSSAGGKTKTKGRKTQTPALFSTEPSLFLPHLLFLLESWLSKSADNRRSLAEAQLILNGELNLETDLWHFRCDLEGGTILPLI